MRASTAFSAISFAFIVFSSFSFGVEVTYDNRAVKINGERKLLLSGAIHYPRSTPEMWQPLIQKSKEGGLNTIETYVFWNAHEPIQRQYDFTGNLDLVRFIKTIRDEGLYAILRIGPYVCAEWTYGGLPVWLHSLPDIKMRTNNPVFKNEMQIFTTLIVDMMKREKLFASQGGPIILAQIENEYGNIGWAYGDEGKNYVKWCANLAQSFQAEIPWIMCQQDDAPLPLISTCNGYYCHQWSPKNDQIPKLWTENWTGWFKHWGGQDPHRTAEDLAYGVARFFQLGGSGQNYYMYHGGTNFKNTAGGPYMTTSYDYDAPLDEYGNPNQPKWGHLRHLHLLLSSMEKILLYGDRQTIDVQKDKHVTVYSYEGNRSCFFSNENANEEFTFDFEGNEIVVPAWSVTLSLDCYSETYNTAKVNAQTSIMVKVPNEADNGEEPFKLKWYWRPEHSLHLDKKGVVKGYTAIANTLLDHKRVTNGTNDNHWLMTSYIYNESSPLWGEKDVVLHVHTDGQVVHAFFNGKHIGSKIAEYPKYEFMFEMGIHLKHGENKISILSGIVGYPGYGEFYDTRRHGVHGPVTLIAKENGAEKVKVDISSNRWVYKTGLRGEDLGLNKINSRHQHKWHLWNRPSNRLFVWYKTTFKSPMGRDPVVADFQGLGKGIAWVNGNNIGRYWSSYSASNDGCSINCDYRGPYKAEKCLTNCGKSSQRWYHIPRSFLNDKENELVLFEELGGTPELVSIQTVTVGTVCANGYERNTLELSCQGGNKFSEIKFASFGLPVGTCGSFNKGDCDSEQSLEVVEKACLGQEKCSMKISEETFGPLRCKVDTYRLAVEAIC